jgi:hypothetical protein
MQLSISCTLMFSVDKIALNAMFSIFWRKNRRPLKLLPAPFQRAEQLMGHRITVAWDFMLVYDQL